MVDVDLWKVMDKGLNTPDIIFSALAVPVSRAGRLAIFIIDLFALYLSILVFINSIGVYVYLSEGIYTYSWYQELIIQNTIDFTGGL